MSVRLVIALLLLALPAPLLAQELPRDDRKPRHTRQDHRRFTTSRRQGAKLALTKEDDAFFFAVFGDRTGGPAAGIQVLDQAVTDVNLLDPDLVMTVGDLVQGYNQTPEWLEQMNEYRGVMDRLHMPWFPVAGNHDVYWRGPNRPPQEHEDHYETHFGPLWYAFEHKDCWFVVLYSDEGDPETGRRSISDADCQKMSPEQLAWLEDVLIGKSREAKHVFVFLHHPRWIGGKYGDDWEKVHAVLKKPGNVRAVFAGHIHKMRYDGRRDGIEYFALATTGGRLSAEMPEAGFLHHYNLVTVRDEGIAVTTVPVGEVIDTRSITGELSDEVTAILKAGKRVAAQKIRLEADGSFSGTLDVICLNPASRPIEFTILPALAGGGWRVSPDHAHVEVAPGKTRKIVFQLDHPAHTFEQFRLPRLEVRSEYLARGMRLALPDRSITIEALPHPETRMDEKKSGVLHLDGEDDAIIVPDARLRVPDGPLTIEGWLCADEFRSRQGFIAKTENGEFGIFVSRGRPEFSIHLDGKYVSAGKGKEPSLKPGVWHHIAGVFDGSEVRIYVDGRLIDATPGKGRRTRLYNPLVVGGDPNSRGAVMSHTPGRIDEVRISKVARYRGEQVLPERRVETDEDTMLLLHLDGALGPFLLDSSGRGAHAYRLGDASIAPFERDR